MAVVGVAPCQCFSPGGNHTKITRPDLLDRSALTLCPAAACHHNEGLAKRMSVPGGPRTGFESYTSALNKGRIECLEQGIDPYHAGEPLRRSVRGRLRANSCLMSISVLLFSLYRSTATQGFL